MRRTIFLWMMALATALCASCTATAEERIGEGQGYGGTVKVSVKMNGADVVSVKVLEHNETEGVGTRAIDTLPDAIAKADSAEVDSVSGATMTSEAIKQAVRQAMGTQMEDSMTIDPGNASEAEGLAGSLSTVRSGMGMAATGRIGPGKDSDGNQVYSLNIVMAAAMFDESGRILHVEADQLEVGSRNMAEGNTFAGFPKNEGEHEDFLADAKNWMTKGAMGDDYRMPSGSWREQMDAYQAQFIGKTVDEVMAWFEQNFDPQTGRPVNDTVSGATMSLRGENGDILTALERAWEDAQSTSDTGDMTNTAPESSPESSPEASPETSPETTVTDSVMG